MVLVGWVVFRADQLSTAMQLLSGMVGLGGNPEAQTIPFAAAWWIGLGVFAVAHVVMGKQILVDRLTRLPDPVYAVAWGVAAGLTLPWVSTEYLPFIYFQF